MTPSDCWVRQSFSRPHDSLTCAAQLLTLTGLELHTAAECCNVQTDDGNPHECVCVRACVRGCVFGKRESTGSCATQHLLRVQLSSFICPLEGKKSSNLLQTRQVGANQASMWEQEKQSLAKQRDRICLLFRRNPTATGNQLIFACKLRWCVYFDFLIALTLKLRLSNFFLLYFFCYVIHYIFFFLPLVPTVLPRNKTKVPLPT